MDQLCRVHKIHATGTRAVPESVSGAVNTGVAIQHPGYTDPALRARKLGRDLRLLEMDHAANPDDPFTLFNLGQVYQEQGRTAEAEASFVASIAR